MNKKIVYTLIFAAIFFLGIMYVAREKEPEYALNLEESLQDITKPTNVVALAELDKIKANKGNKPFVFVDIRSPYDFVKGHMDQALNIPFNNMFSEENRKIFNQLKAENVDVILYGNDQSQANAPCMLLRQLGYLNVSLLAGGYSGYIAPADSLGKKPNSYDEQAMFNYAIEMKKKAPLTSSTAIQVEPAKVKVAPVVQKKKLSLIHI